MSTPPVEFDPIYVRARSVLLDALEALKPHRGAVIVAGAQAVYLRTGLGELAIAPYTTDGDLALDPTLLGDAPELEQVMSAAGFHLLELHDRVEPGIWVATEIINGQEVIIPVDLIIPEGIAPPGGRRGARLGAHGPRAARRVPGMEAVLVDHDTMTVAALDPGDGRAIDVEVAGVAALLVAKIHKIQDRLGGRPDRLQDKDAADVFRIMQTTSPDEVGRTLAALRDHAIVGPTTSTALDIGADLFARVGGQGVVMASRALRLAMPEARITQICVAYMTALLEATAAQKSG